MTLLKIASIVCLGATLAGALVPPAAAKKKTKPADVLASTPPETALHAYIERVRAQQAAEVKTGDRSGAPKAGWFGLAPTPRRHGCTTWFRSS